MITPHFQQLKSKPLLSIAMTWQFSRTLSVWKPLLHFSADLHYQQQHDVINDLVLTNARGLLNLESGGMILDGTVRVGMAARFWAGMYLRCAQGGCCTVPSRPVRACVPARRWRHSSILSILVTNLSFAFKSDPLMFAVHNGRLNCSLSCKLAGICINPRSIMNTIWGLMEDSVDGMLHDSWLQGWRDRSPSVTRRFFAAAAVFLVRRCPISWGCNYVSILTNLTMK